MRRNRWDRGSRGKERIRKNFRPGCCVTRCKNKRRKSKSLSEEWTQRFADGVGGERPTWTNIICTCWSCWSPYFKLQMIKVRGSTECCMRVEKNRWESSQRVAEGSETESTEFRPFGPDVVKGTKRERAGRNYNWIPILPSPLPLSYV